jgi:hypothetical protein
MGPSQKGVVSGLVGARHAKPKMDSCLRLRTAKSGCGRDRLISAPSHPHKTAAHTWCSLQVTTVSRIFPMDLKRCLHRLHAQAMLTLLRRSSVFYNKRIGILCTRKTLDLIED